jgi:hypothetical protein
MICASEENLLYTRQDELIEIMDELKDLLTEHKLTKEEFAILYGYIYLARHQLMRIDDIRFMLKNTLFRHNHS